MRNQIRAGLYLLSRSAYLKGIAALMILLPLASVIMTLAVNGPFGLSVTMTPLYQPLLHLLPACSCLVTAGIVSTDRARLGLRNACVSDEGWRGYVASRFVSAGVAVCVLLAVCLVWGGLFNLLYELIVRFATHWSVELRLPAVGSEEWNADVAQVPLAFAYAAMTLLIAWLLQTKGWLGSWLVTLIVNGQLLFSAVLFVLMGVSYLFGHDAFLALMKVADAASITQQASAGAQMNLPLVCGMAVVYVAVCLAGSLALRRRRAL